MTKRFFELILGLFLFAVGSVVIINADLGYSPWNVFHKGIANIFHMQIGTASIITGILLVAVGILYGRKPGIGTMLNMILIGMFMNLLMSFKIIPVNSNLYVRLVSIPIAMIITGLASYLYIRAGWGVGPRDGLMLFLLQKTNKSLRFIRNSIEITVLIIGFLLGGPIGIGTVILSLGLGFSIQLVFKLFKFDPNIVIHREWDDEVNVIKKFVKIVYCLK